jgi:hypothetical protein
MASLAGTQWQFFSPTAQFPSPVAPGPVYNLSGTWTEGPRHISFTFNISCAEWDVTATGTHGDPTPGQGSGSITWVPGQTVPFSMIKS